MAEVVKMPRLSDTMEEGTVAKWHKKVGDKVSEGDLLAEIETDKATMDFESFQEGVLLHIGVEEGDTVEVDALLAVLGEKDEDISDLLEGGDDDSGSPKKEQKEDKEEDPSEEEDDKDKDKDKEEDQDTEKEGKDDEDGEEDKDDKEDENKKPSKGADHSDQRLKASPLAKKLAEEKGIDINEVEGSGEGGRIVKRDIDNYQPAAKAQTPAMTSAFGEEGHEDVKVSQMRKTIAKRLAESKYSAPHFYLTIDMDMENAMQARKSINEISETKVSFNDLVVKASAVALQKHPSVNAAWMDNKIRQFKHVHIGVAVAVDEGLMVPVVRHANIKGLNAINAEIKKMAEQARSKKLAVEDMEGGTFAISNLGMFGIEEFTAIINPPNSCILAVGTIREEPVVKNGQIVVGHRMKVTLSCDHRVVDGATGAAFLQTLKGMIENPAAMLI